MRFLLIMIPAAAAAAVSHPPALSSHESLRQAFDQVRHQARPCGAGFAVTNGENGIAAEFTSLGMNALHASGAFALRLQTYGYGERVSPPQPAEVIANGPLVELRRGALVEWYVNERRGLEQGFTLFERPGESRGEPLVLNLLVSGELTPKLSGGAVLLERDGAERVRYDGLKAWDAAGRELTARMEVSGRHVRLLVTDHNAVYPVVIDPWIQQQKLTAPDGAEVDSFGFSLAVSGDTAVVGANGKDSGQGAAYVFVRNGNAWSQQQKLTALDGAAADRFGYSVGVSGDTVIVGAWGKSLNRGAAYVFVRSGGVWIQQQKLTVPGGAPNDMFGYSVAVSGDTAVVGAWGAASYEGIAYVFVRNGGLWSLEQLLPSPNHPNSDSFGISVAVNGETAVVGSSGTPLAPGAAYVFVRGATLWTQQQKLTASDAANGDGFGFSVSLSGDTAIVGAADKPGTPGAAYAFVRSGATWSQQQKLIASDGAGGDRFGFSVAVSGDTAVVGALQKANYLGAAYVFTRSGSLWSQQQKLTAPDGLSGNQFGISVSVSGDTTVAGGVRNTSLQGAAYVFTPGDGAIPFGSSWKYLVTSTDQGAAWRTQGFDDSAWPSGAARLGYGSTQATTIGFGNNPNNKNVTTYFRKTFNVTSRSEIRFLVLSLIRADGAVVYLNGTELARSNMPSGAIAYQTLATREVTGGDETAENIYSIDPLLLNNGANVIAVEIHRASAASSRLGFDLKLTPSSTPLPAALKFVPVTPCRLVDTRPVYAGLRNGTAFGPPLLKARVERTIPVSGSPTCAVPATAKAYVLNVTFDTLFDSSGPFDCATIWPTGEPRPDYCNARTSTGGYIANAAIVRAGIGGAINAFSSQNVDLIVDINGYFTDDPLTPGLLYYPVSPCRAVDTRGPIYSAPRQPPYGNQKMQAQENRTFRLPDSPACQLPAAAAYSMQMTLAPGDTTSGQPVAFLTAYPTGVQRPDISNMNSIFGYAVANSAIVPAANGSIDVYAYNATNVILDVNGYFAPDDGTGRGLFYYPRAQCRLTAENDAAMTTGTDRTVNLMASPCLLPQGATPKAFFMNAAVLPAGTPLAYLSMWPTGTAWPNVSQLNAFEGQTAASSGIVPSSVNAAIDVRVLGTSRVVLEMAGFFGR